MTMHWSARHLGIAYAEKGRSDAGLDCWGCVWRIYARELGIDLPSYADGYTCHGERQEIDALFGAAQSAPWHRVSAGEARAFDVPLFSLGPYAAHVGVLVDKDRMIHVERGRETIVERWTSQRWASRLLGIHRHEDVRP